MSNHAGVIILPFLSLLFPTSALIIQFLLLLLLLNDEICTKSKQNLNSEKWMSLFFPHDKSETHSKARVENWADKFVISFENREKDVIYSSNSNF